MNELHFGNINKLISNKTKQSRNSLTVRKKRINNNNNDEGIQTLIKRKCKAFTHNNEGCEGRTEISDAEKLQVPQKRKHETQSTENQRKNIVRLVKCGKGKICQSNNVNSCTCSNSFVIQQKSQIGKNVRDSHDDRNSKAFLNDLHNDDKNDVTPPISNKRRHYNNNLSLNGVRKKSIKSDGDLINENGLVIRMNINDCFQQIDHAKKLFSGTVSHPFTKANRLKSTFSHRANDVTFNNQNASKLSFAEVKDRKQGHPCVSRESQLSEKSPSTSFDLKMLKCKSNLFCNATDDYKVLVLLRKALHFYGTVRVKVLLGAVRVYGYNPPLNKQFEIFSPRGDIAIGIEVLPNNKGALKQKTKMALRNILQKFKSKYLKEDLCSLIECFNPQTDAIILLSRNTKRKLLQSQFNRFMDQNIFPNTKNLNVQHSMYNTEYRLRCLINAPMKTLKINLEWENLRLDKDSRILIAGGKGVGKSTLLRYLVNKHLRKYKRILLVDLDIGQPEIFIPQTISCCLLRQPLVGPGFMLNLQPDKSYVVGHTNIIMCADKYIQATKKLFEHCNGQSIYENIPWIINTMGYNKGFGLELLSIICENIKLTDLIQIQSMKEVNNYDHLLYPQTLLNTPRQMFPIEGEGKKFPSDSFKYELHVMKSAVNDTLLCSKKEWTMTAKDLRYCNLLSRFTLCTTEWLTDCKPLKAHLSDLKIINLQGSTECTEERELLTKVIDANLVYLCHYDSSDLPLECFGIGVLRGLDYNLNQVYIVSAAPLESFYNINCLAIGEMPLPSTLFVNQGPRICGTIPFVYNTIDTKGSKAIKHFCRRLKKV